MPQGRARSRRVAHVDGATSIPSDGATAWMTANWPMPAAMAGSRRTAARVTPGAICFSSSSHFPLKLYSNCTKPVALPPGRARLSTKPEPTGSGTFANTIGTVRLACSNGPTVVPPVASMTSGVRATNSAAYLRMSSALPAPQRMSIFTLRPSDQPNCCSPCRKAAILALPCGSSAAKPISTPMRRIRSACCARAATDHAAAPPSRAMNSRRLMRVPILQGHRSHSNRDFGSALCDVRLGSEADICSPTADVRFTLNSDCESGFPQKAMSALPP